jgi:hypothetical protein
MNGWCEITSGLRLLAFSFSLGHNDCGKEGGSLEGIRGSLQLLGLSWGEEIEFLESYLRVGFYCIRLISDFTFQSCLGVQ